MISLDGHIEATRPHQRIPCSKGEEGYVVPSGLGVRREDESAVGAGRRRIAKGRALVTYLIDKGRAPLLLT